MKSIILLLMATAILKSVPCKAQDSTRVNLSLHEVGIDEVINALEKQVPHRFYYNPLEVDSLRFSVDVKNQPFTMTLESLFSNTGILFSIYNKSVFLSKGRSILTTLPSNFRSQYNAKETTTNKIENLQTETAEPSQEKIGGTVATLENKVYVLGNPATGSAKSTATLSGYIRSANTGEPVIGASIFISNPRIGIVTDVFGFYSLTLPKGKHELQIRALGLRDTKRQIHLYADGKLDINVQEQIMSLKEVVISADKTSNIKRVQMGVEKLDIKTIKQVPTVFGEADVLRVVLTLPGVKSVGESSAGFNVRGGAVDQNLILFNDATIYNPTHFFGFFSAFNPEVIKDIQLYKSSIPAKYGGRLSSVLELNSKEGNKKKIQGSAGLGLLTSRLNLEGPIITDRTSFVLGARTTYSNWIFKVLPDKAGYKDAKASFYDLNLNLSHQQNSKNNFYLTGYFSSDDSNLASDTSYAYNNQNLSLKWKHNFNNKFQSTISTGIDNYKYQSYSSSNEVNAYRLRFNINQANVKSEFTYFLNSKHTLDFGLHSIHYNLRPSELKPFSDKSLIVQDVVATERALESAIYVGDRFDLSPAISFNAGLRYSLFNNLGPSNVTFYNPNLPKEENNIEGTKSYKKGEVVKSYHGPEYRFSARFALSSDFSIKTSYNTLRQNIHMLSNTTSMSPTDIWKLSDMNIKPQNGDQVSLGFYKNFKSSTIETSLEGYYKRLNNYLDYKSGATLILNHNIEQAVITTKGKAYGVEFMVKKATGKLNGWFSYTYSRTLLRTNDPIASENINQGQYYPANYDKPHDLTLIGNYRFSHRISFSFNTTYSTGRPITLPIARYTYAQSQRVFYGERNAYRIPDYFRSDISLNLEGNHKVKQLTHNSWTLGIYNITGRKNAFATYFVSERGIINGYKLSIFGTAIPFVNYNIRF